MAHKVIIIVSIIVSVCRCRNIRININIKQYNTIKTIKNKENISHFLYRMEDCFCTILRFFSRNLFI